MDTESKSKRIACTRVDNSRVCYNNEYHMYDLEQLPNILL